MLYSIEHVEFDQKCPFFSPEIMQWLKMKLYTHSVGFQEEEHFMSTVIYTMFSTFLTCHYYIPLSFSI